MKKIGKREAEKKIKDFFKNLKNKSPEQVRKMKRLSMRHNIKLGNLRKKFCKYCYSIRLKVKGIKRGMKTVVCRNCGKISRWKIK